jgi:transposase
MTRPGRYPQELREPAVPMVFEHQDEHPSQWAAICSIAAKFGTSQETLRHWVRRAETDEDLRPGLTTGERERLKTPKRENRELRRANETLKAASARAVRDAKLRARSPGFTPSTLASRAPARSGGSCTARASRCPLHGRAADG